MLNPRVSGEKLPGFSAADEDDAGAGKAALGGVKQDTGDGDVGTEGYAGEDKHGLRIGGNGARIPHAAIAGNETCGVELRNGVSNHFGKQLRIRLGQARLEEIRQAFDDDAKKGIGTLRRCETAEKAAGPALAGEAAGEQPLGQIVTRSTCQ